MMKYVIASFLLFLSRTSGTMDVGSKSSLKESSNAEANNWGKQDSMEGVNAEGGGDASENTEVEGHTRDTINTEEGPEERKGLEEMPYTQKGLEGICDQEKRASQAVK